MNDIVKEPGHYFTDLLGVNVNEHIEKKNGFSFLSWPFAVAELRKRHPDATWEVIRSEGKPFTETSAGCFVEVAVTVGGITLSQIHPVIDHRNKTIPQPTAFDINTSIQRALVKAIALHGLGLYIYAGEDLPPGGEKEEEPDPRRAQMVADLKASADDGIDSLKAAWGGLSEEARKIVGKDGLAEAKAHAAKVA